MMGLGVVPDLLVSVDKLDLGWIRRWLSDYNDHKVVAPTLALIVMFLPCQEHHEPASNQEQARTR